MEGTDLTQKGAEATVYSLCASADAPVSVVWWC